MKSLTLCMTNTRCILLYLFFSITTHLLFYFLLFLLSFSKRLKENDFQIFIASSGLPYVLKVCKSSEYYHKVIDQTTDIMAECDTENTHNKHPPVWTIHALISVELLFPHQLYLIQNFPALVCTSHNKADDSSDCLHCPMSQDALSYNLSLIH